MGRRLAHPAAGASRCGSRSRAVVSWEKEVSRVSLDLHESPGLLLVRGADLRLCLGMEPGRRSLRGLFACLELRSDVHAAVERLSITNPTYLRLSPAFRALHGTPPCPSRPKQNSIS